MSIGAKRFGIEVAKPTPKACAPTRREVRIQHLRFTEKWYKLAGEVQMSGLAELRAILRKELLTLRRVESPRRRRKERARRRAAFLANPYQLTKRFLGRKRGLTCSSDEINNHIKCSYSNHKKDQPLESCKALINPPEPVLSFDLEEASLTRWRKSSGGQEPSQHRRPSGVPYKVYKNCPKLRQRLWRSLKVIWRRGRIAQLSNALKEYLYPKRRTLKILTSFGSYPYSSWWARSFSASGQKTI